MSRPTREEVEVDLKNYPVSNWERKIAEAYLAALDEIGELRMALWLGHGHTIELYGDDGEMQCGACILDFKRDPVERLTKCLKR